MIARRTAQLSIIILVICVVAIPNTIFGARAQDATGLCATTPDPALCEQLKSQAESSGAIPGQGAGGLSMPGQASGEINGIIQGPAPTVTQTVASPQTKRSRGRSHLEEFYAQRAGLPLDQYGYDLVGNGSTISALQIGAIQDDYILGQGDAIVITLRGQDNATYTVFVDRDGNVTLPRLRPVSASGRRFGEFRADLNSAIKQSYLQTQAYVTIGQVRQISVNVVGEVANPGVYALSGLSTVLDALNVAGGIRKSGSLRTVSIVRNNRELAIDLYKFLAPDGYAPNITLRQGDRVYVGPLGATVAVGGDVRRAGIYELPAGGRTVTARALLALGDGYIIRGAYRLTAVRTLPDGKLEFDDITSHSGAVLRDGEVLLVKAAQNYTLGNITLEGNVRLPGVYGLNSARTLHDLVPSADALLPMTYMPFGFVIRLNKRTLMRDVIAFSVQALIDGKFDVPLESQDIVHILDFQSMHRLVATRAMPMAPKDNRLNGNLQNGTPDQEQANGPGTGQQGMQADESGMATAKVLLQSLAGQVGQQGGNARQASDIATNGGPGQSSADSGAPGANGPVDAAAAASAGLDEGAAGLNGDESAAVGFVVSDYRVTVEGSVRQPGDYLAAPGAKLSEIVSAANGLRPDANLNAIEITSVAIDNVGGQSQSTRKLYSLTQDRLRSVELQRLDVVRIPGVISDQQDGSVSVAGEVQFPGTFHILKGERLSSVLARAGGLSGDAYPFGAIFQRPSVAQVQQMAHQREADDLQKQLMAGVARAGNVLNSSSGQSLGLSAEGAGFVAGVIAQLRAKPADGRLSVIADPAALAADPEADIELQPGDRLFVPKRPSEVDVTGEVLNPGSFRFSPRLDVADYIGQSGGYDRYADDDHIFVVNPDGTSRRIADDLFDFSPAKLAPGSVVVVPRDLAPLDLGVLTVTITKVLSDLAVSAASLAILSRTN
ncbi:MAG TPA: SLBB domain-containing protein [Rhizomicrobium sp.]